MLDVRCEMTASLVYIIAIPLQIFVRLNARSYSTLYNQAMPWFLALYSFTTALLGTA